MAPKPMLLDRDAGHVIAVLLGGAAPEMDLHARRLPALASSRGSDVVGPGDRGWLMKSTSSPNWTVAVAGSNGAAWQAG